MLTISVYSRSGGLRLLSPDSFCTRWQMSLSKVVYGVLLTNVAQILSAEEGFRPALDAIVGRQNGHPGEPRQNLYGRLNKQLLYNFGCCT